MVLINAKQVRVNVLSGCGVNIAARTDGQTNVRTLPAPLLRRWNGVIMGNVGYISFIADVLPGSRNTD